MLMLFVFSFSFFSVPSLRYFLFFTAFLRQFSFLQIFSWKSPVNLSNLFFWISYGTNKPRRVKSSINIRPLRLEDSLKLQARYLLFLHCYLLSAILWFITYSSFLSLITSACYQSLLNWRGRNALCIPSYSPSYDLSAAFYMLLTNVVIYFLANGSFR